jgi:hypothetical protein
MRRRGALVTFVRWARGVVAGALLPACGSHPPILPTPYQAFTNAEGAIPGGYIDRSLGPGTYVITFRGDQATLWEDTLAYAHRRARELCPAGYDALAEQDVSAEIQGDGRTVAVRLGYTTIVKHSPGAITQLPRARLEIRCKVTVPG